MKKSLTSTFETLIVGFFLAILIMIFVGQSLEITGDSMYPTLKNGERIIVEKVTYKSRQPKEDEIIVFRSLQNESVFLIKRVIAVPGDKITLGEGGNVTVLSPGNKSQEFGTVDNLGVLKDYETSPVPNGYIAVMGDNRKESYDSRMFGLVPLDRVVGKAFIVYWPLSAIRKI